MEVENPNTEGRDVSNMNGHPSPRLHRIGEIRRQQGVSVHCAARRMDMDVGDVKTQEEGDADIMLSTLYKWQQILDVPIANLLVDEYDPLSQPVLKRAQMVRLVKTAATLMGKSECGPSVRLAQMLIDQLIEMMPDLQEVYAVCRKDSEEDPG